MGSHRNRRRSLAVLLSWLGLAIALWSLSIASLAAYVPFRHSLAGTALLLVALLTAFGGTSILVGQAIAAWKSASKRMASLRSFRYRQRFGDPGDIDKVVAWGRQTVGDAHPDAGVVGRRLEENPEVLRVCLREWKSGRVKFCGYALLYPLADDAGKGILAGSIRSEAEFGPTPLAPDFQSARYLYIGMVLGTDRHATPHVTDRLRSEIAAILAGGRVEAVFARPVSPDGLALMREYGFKPILADDGIWSVSATTLRGQLHLEQAPATVLPLGGDSKRLAGRGGGTSITS